MMRIKFIQNYIDLLRGKTISNLEKRLNYLENKGVSLLKDFINGNDNQIRCINEKFITEIKYKSNKNRFKINGNNNKIIFHFKNKNIKTIPEGLNITILGNNNVIEIFEPNFSNSKIYIKYDNNNLTIKSTVKNIEGAYICVERGATIQIEKDCELGNGMLRLFATGDYKNKHRIFIDEGTHIAHGAIIRNSDGECLIDAKTKEALSEPKDILIGKNCWITSRCTILKGTVLPNGTIVGACSLVNKKFEKENCLLVGTPARIIKENVSWVPYSYGEYMEKQEVV